VPSKYLGQKQTYKPKKGYKRKESYKLLVSLISEVIVEAYSKLSYNGQFHFYPLEFNPRPLDIEFLHHDSGSKLHF